VENLAILEETVDGEPKHRTLDPPELVWDCLRRRRDRDGSAMTDFITSNLPPGQLMPRTAECLDESNRRMPDQLLSAERRLQGQQTEALWEGKHGTPQRQAAVRALRGDVNSGGVAAGLTGLAAVARQGAQLRLARLEDHRWALAEFRSTRPWEVAVAVDEIGRFDSTGWLHTLRLPTAVVVTTRDRFIAPEHQRSLARRIPDAATYDVAAGHAACVLAADRFVPALLAAVASVSAGS